MRHEFLLTTGQEEFPLLDKEEDLWRQFKSTTKLREGEEEEEVESESEDEAIEEEQNEQGAEELPAVKDLEP